MSVVALMFLLLPFLLLTTSVNKLVGLELGLPAEGGALPPPTRGALEDLEIQIQGADLRVEARVRRMDVRAATGETELRAFGLPAVDGAMDLAGLQAALRELQALDPERTRARISPSDAADARRVVLVMDAARGDAAGPLFPEIVLATHQTSSEESPPAPVEGAP